MDPSALIRPVTDALGTLGDGLFGNGADPTAMLQGISQAFQSTGGSLNQSLGSVEDAWKGNSGTTAAAKTTTAIANGKEVGAQSDALKSSLATAATNVAQARVRLIEILAEFQATMAAIGPNIIFPWGWAAAITAANKAIASTAEVMTELQTTLGTEAAQVTAAGTPVDVTAAPQLASSSAAQSSMSSLAPLMSMATKGAQAGIQAGTGAASAASQAAAQQAQTDPTAAAAGGFAGAQLAGAGAGAGGGGGVGGGAAALAPRSIASSAMVQPETASATAQSAVRAASVGAVGGSGGMMGGGAPYGPMAGQGANNSSNNHTAAAFLHTSDQGGEIVGDLGTAAPPVLGEADPNESPDVELRI